MGQLGKDWLRFTVMGAVLGFVFGVIGTRIDNYQSLSGPSFPQHPWEPFRRLGYPGFCLAGRAGAEGFIDGIHSYEWHKVALWNALTWGCAVGAVALATRRIARKVRRPWGSAPQRQ